VTPRRLVFSLFAVALVACGLLGAGTGAADAGRTAPAAHKTPKVKHVFIIVLENENYGTSFGPKSDAPYLAHTLVKKGELLKNYYATGHASLDNYIAMISGQGPNIQTQTDCQFFRDFTATPGANGQYVNPSGGCVFPPGAENIANQLEDAGYRWHEYAQDMNAHAPKGKQDPCRHPGLNAHDTSQTAVPGDEYAARHDPFVYFHSIIDFPTCARNVVDFSHLRHDLKHERTTPSYSFITPNLCTDGHDAPCVDGRPGGLKSANNFLAKRVPGILRSPAFKDRGLLIVAFDEAEGSGSAADSTACCNEQPGPNTVPPNTPGFIHPGPGGGKVGAVLVSPCIKPGTVNKHPYNHYSMLRSIEDNFGLSHLGYAGQKGLKPFGSTVLNRPSCGGA
jgi:hypothetical protein